MLVSTDYEEPLNWWFHPTSEIETKEIGENTMIWRWVHISPKVKIGKNCMIGQGCYIGPNVIIGNNVRIQNGAYIPEGIIIENGVFIGPNVVFTNDRYAPSELREGVLVKEGVSIGANATILPGIIIGEYSTIGAGSVVCKNVEKWDIICGNPAISTSKKRNK